MRLRQAEAFAHIDADEPGSVTALHDAHQMIFKRERDYGLHDKLHQYYKPTRSLVARISRPYKSGMQQRRKPKPDSLDQLIQVRCNAGFLDRLDDWRRAQDDLPSRAEAIRRIVAAEIDKTGREGRRR